MVVGVLVTGAEVSGIVVGTSETGALVTGTAVGETIGATVGTEVMPNL